MVLGKAVSLLSLVLDMWCRYPFRLPLGLEDGLLRKRGAGLGNASSSTTTQAAQWVILCRSMTSPTGQTILVLGAAGGVGLAAVQLARTMGARVIAVARGQDKMAALKQASGGLLCWLASQLLLSALWQQLACMLCSG